MQNKKHLLPDKYKFEFFEADIKRYTFKTVAGVLYTATFKPSGYIFPNEAPLLQENVFEFSIIVIEKPEGKLPPADNLIPATIAAIFHHFFTARERVIVYICETADMRASARMRKFNQWFEWYKGEEFLQVSLPIEEDEESGQKYYTAMIFHVANPYVGTLVQAYTDLIKFYNK